VEFGAVLAKYSDDRIGHPCCLCCAKGALYVSGAKIMCASDHCSISLFSYIWLRFRRPYPMILKVLSEPVTITTCRAMLWLALGAPPTIAAAGNTDNRAIPAPVIAQARKKPRPTFIVLALAHRCGWGLRCTRVWPNLLSADCLDAPFLPSARADRRCPACGSLF